MEALVEFALPFPIYLPNTMDQNGAKIGQPIQIASPVAEIHLTRVIRTNVGIAVPLEMDGGDPYGRFSFSVLSVRLRVPADAKTDQWPVAHQAVSAVNALICQYRDVAEQPLIPQVATEAIGHFILSFMENGQLVQPATTLATGYGPAVGRATAEQQKREDKIRERLASNSEISIFREFELRAHQLFYQQEYRGAIIETAILFEAWLKSRLHSAFLRKGLTDELTRLKFLNDKKHPRTADYVAKHLVKEATGFDFSITNEYRLWRAEVADVRNDLVHGTRRSAVRGDAERAIDAVNKAIAILRAKTGIA